MSRTGFGATRVAELIAPLAEVLAVTVAVYDRGGSLVAAAGPDAAEVPAEAGPGGPADHVMHCTLQLAVDRTQGHPLCATCPEAARCRLTAEFFTPVVAENEVVGAVGVLTPDPARGKQLSGQRAVVLQLLRQVAEGLALRLQAQELPERVRQLRGQIRHLVQHLDRPAILAGPDLTVVSCNAGGARLAGRPISECLGRPLAELLPAPVAEACQTGRAHSGLEADGWFCDLQPITDGHRSLGTLVLFREEAEEPQSRRAAGRHHPFTMDSLRGGNPAFVAVKEMAKRVARADTSVLIRGESGTGKELFARAIHAESGRRGPFVALNCAAIPEQLLESELFGYEDGAFTGARRGGKPGKFELADGGTLFLDEIGDLPLHLQTKLLRVLQFKEVERVGGTHPVPVDFRLVAATHRPLEEMIADGRFRTDLYYRINVISLEIPPLRERKDDLYLLMELFGKRLALRTGQPVKRWTAEALNLMFRYPWPGNVRELENAIEHAWLVETTDLIRPASLPARMRHWAEAEAEAAPPAPVTPIRVAAPRRREPPADAPVPPDEREAILAALARFGTTTRGKEAAARALGISRATLYRRLKALQLG